MMTWRVIYQALVLAALAAASTFLPIKVSGQDFRAKPLDECLDAQGRIVNDTLRKTTGWNVIRAFRWIIELEGTAGEFSAVDAGAKFRNGQRVKIRIEALTDMHVYVLALNADGSEEVLIPQRFEQPALVKRGEAISLPTDGGALRFTPPAGKERLRLIAAREPLPWIAGRELFKLQSGEELTKQERETLEQLKSLRTRSLKDALRVHDKLPKAMSLAKAFAHIQDGQSPRGTDALLIESATKGNLVGFATADAMSTTLIVNDIVLEHTE